MRGASLQQRRCRVRAARPAMASRAATLCQFCHAPGIFRNDPNDRHFFCFVVLSTTNQRGCPVKSQVVKRSVVLDGHKSSVSLEDAFWMGLKEIACTRVVTLSGLVTSIDAQRQQGNLSSALRLYVLEFYRSQVPATDGWEGPGERMDRPEALLSQG
jgi:predicted DNA-binding ribbon-helix-helix protein